MQPAQSDLNSWINSLHHLIRVARRRYQHDLKDPALDNRSAGDVDTCTRDCRILYDDGVRDYRPSGGLPACATAAAHISPGRSDNGPQSQPGGAVRCIYRKNV